jgi:hypothetical protein
MAITGSVDIGNGPLAVTIDHDPLTVATDVAMGSLLVDTSGEWWRKLDDGSTTNVVRVSTIATSERIIRPEFVTGGDATNITGGDLEGGSYSVGGFFSFNRLHWRIASGATGGETIGIFIYQAPDGGAGVANLVATMSGLDASVGGNLVATPSEGTVILVPGLCWILYGRDDADAAGPALQTYITAGLNLVNQNVPAGLHPVQLTTTILASSPPATFDPTAHTETMSNIALVVRMATA